MAAAADLNSEPNFIVHWMSNASRAGVILNPSFHVMKTNRDRKSSETVNITSHPIKMLHVSNSSCSISEDAMHEEQILESGSPCGLQLDATETTFPAFHLVKKKTVLTLKDAPALWKAPKTDSVCDEMDDQNEADYSDPLLQKLEQLKEIQQQKQEQLKKQQMEQLQRLMEEQKKLLSMVSGWQGLPDYAIMSEDLSQQYGHPADSNAEPYLTPLVYQNLSRDSTPILNGFSFVSSHTRESELLQKLNNKECILSLKSSLSSDSVCDKQCLAASLKMQNGLTNEDHKNTTGESTWCPKEKMEKSVVGEDSDIDHLHSGNVDFSESPNGRKCLRTANTEERPIKAGIQERKQTFEEFLEEQIQLEDQRLKQKAEQQEVERSTFQKPLTKRPFLKRGEGLTRFTNAKSKVTKYKESKLMTQQSASEDRNIVKADRPQIQRKTAPLSKEQISENFAVPFKKCNRVAKITNGSVFPAQKAMILKNYNGKSISPSTVRAETKKALDGQFRDSFRSEINSKLENKENIMEIEIGSKFKNKFADIKKPQLPTEFINTFSLSKCSTSCPVKDSELSFELSFQNKLENWEKEKEKENIELDEFLFLEQAADEISFSSNSSFVQRILDQDQQISKGRRMSSTPVKAMQQQQMNALDVINNTNKKEIILQGNKNDRAVTNTVLDSRASFRLRDQFSKTDDKIFQTSSIAATPTLKSTEWNVNEDKDDESSVNTTDSEEELETTLKCANKDAKKDILSSREDNPEFCDCTGPIKDVSKESKCRDVDLDLSDKDYSSDESSVLPNHSNSKISDSQKSVSCINRNKAEFDDERTWTDLEENESLHEVLQNDIIKVPPLTDYCNKIEMAAPDKTIKRKVASIKKDDLPKQCVTDSDASAPPTSDLMMKLFPSLKPKQKPDRHARHETKANVGQEEPGGDIVRSQVLREKLVELETEIERFRAENASLTKLREERESSLENLRREIADFEQQKTKELARIEEVKKEEMRKLQKERKVFEKYATAARAMPDKKERDEIQALKQQLADFQEDLKRREAKWSTTHGRLRNQIETLTKENTELREEIKIMERFRLEIWKKAEAAESNRKAGSTGINLRRAESISPPTRLQKSQILFPVPQTEKHSKMNGKGCYSPAKGKPSRKPKSAPVSDRSNFDKTMMTLEDSSRTFMVDMSPTETCVPSEPPTPVSTGSEEIQGEINYPDGKVEKVLKNGCHLIFFPNGTRKEVSSDGKTITVTFFNGDVKQVMPDQRVIYYYADAQTTHTTYPDGLEVLHFSNGQIEKHYPDGRKEITFPDQTIKNLFMDGREESIFPDGTIVHVQRDGSKTIEFNNGQRELHTSQFKRREYPDGTVKTVYANGHQETKYVCGRVRVKDKDGNVIMDTKL